MTDLPSTFKAYKKIDITLSIEEEREQMYAYVYATNKLEGNRLTLAQTTQLLSTETISGEHIRTSDILEQKGMYKALSRMLKFVRDKENLSIDLLLELNWIALGHLWNYEDAYVDVKAKGQKSGEFKISRNLIRNTQNGKTTQNIEPLSSPDNILQNMEHLLNTIAKSDKPIIEQAAYLAQELWLHQPFVDGNKRTGRLLINFLTMKAGYPLFIFDAENQNYNSLLVEQYLEGKANLIVDYVSTQLIRRMQEYIDVQNKLKPNGNGFRMVL